MIATFRKFQVFVLLLLSVTYALPTDDVVSVTKNNEFTKEVLNDCSQKDSVSCIKYKVITFVDKMLEQRENININDGVTIEKSGEVIKTEGAPRNLGTKSSLETVVAGKLVDFLRNRVIKVELKGNDIVEAVTSAGRTLDDIVTTISKDSSNEARGKKKKAKLLGPLFLAIALKLAALLPLAIGAIALIAGKALLIGKIALVLSSIIGLKKLLSQEKHVTYEVVAHPQHTSSHSTSHSEAVGGSGYSSDIGSLGSGSHGWGRNLDAQNLVYKAHV